MFDIVEEVVLVYNKKLKELYGEEGKINIIKFRCNCEWIDDVMLE